VLYIFSGPDTFSRAEAVANIKAKLDVDGMLQANTVEFDGRSVDVQALLSTCDTVPFLAEHRLVIVTDLLQQPRQQRNRSARGTRGGQTGGSIDRLVEYVPNMPQTTTLLLVEAESTDRASLSRLQPIAEVKLFPLKDERQVQEWIRTRAVSRGITLEPAAVQMLARGGFGGDLWTLASEMEKLALWAGDRPITDADIRRLVPSAQDSNVFAMVDAIVAGKLGAALTQLRLLQHDGAPGPYLLTMIARQYRQLIVVEDLSACGASTATIAREVGIRSEGVVPRLVQQARRLGSGRLRAAFERIVEADVAIKRGEMSEDVAVELLVTDLSNGELRTRASADWG
jgi:DNA polymerase III subunit delta